MRYIFIKSMHLLLLLLLYYYDFLWIQSKLKGNLTLNYLYFFLFQTKLLVNYNGKYVLELSKKYPYHTMIYDRNICIKQKTEM